MAGFLLFLPLVKVSSESTELVHPLPWDEYLLFSLISLALVLFGGMMSGLTVGLMSLDETELELKLASGTPHEQEQARRVLPVISKHHFLLVTLLVANAAAMETLPLFLDDMFATVLAVVLSVTFVLAFGEVIPQAMCTGPDQLKIASRLIPVVKIVEVLFFPISYPIAKLLDHIFGHRAKGHRSSEDLKMLVTMQSASDDTRDGLSPKQVEMIHGAIDAGSETVGPHSIPLHSVFRVSANTSLTRSNVRTIVKSGYSRVPVHKENEPDTLLGVLLVKKLLELDEWQGQPLVPTCELRTPLLLDERTPILKALSNFEQGRSHMAFVTGANNQLLGIITLEDALEVLLKTKIEDESDYDMVSPLKKVPTKRPISKRRLAGAGSHPLIV